LLLHNAIQTCCNPKLGNTSTQTAVLYVLKLKLTGMQIIAGSRENYPAVNMIFPAVKHHFFLKMFLNAVKRFSFIYFVYLHLHCSFTWTERIVNTPFSATIVSFASHCPFQWSAIFALHRHVCEIMNAKLGISHCWNIISCIQCREKERKMILRPLVSWNFLSLPKETRLVLRNQVTLLKEARLALISSLNYLQGKLKQMLSLETICLLTSFSFWLSVN